MNLKQFLTGRLSRVAIIFTIIYQFIMAIVYLPAYQTLEDNANHSNITLVNSDSSKAGNDLNNNIKHSLTHHDTPKIKETTDLHKARNHLSQGETLLVIQIPKHTTKDLSQGKSVNLNFYKDNYANQSTANIAQKVQDNLTTGLNTNISKETNTKIITKAIMESPAGKDKVTQAVQAAVQQNPTISQDPAAMQNLQNTVTSGIVKQTADQVGKQLSSTPVNANVINASSRSDDKVKLSLTLGIMFLGLGCFISMMTASTITLADFKKSIRSGNNGIKSFLYLEVLYAIISILSPLISVITFQLITHLSPQLTLAIYPQNVLLTFVSAQIVSIATLILGRIGILINLPIALVQTLLSGAIVPVAFLPKVYRILFNVLPMPYHYAAVINLESGIDSHTVTDGDIKMIAIGVTAFLIDILILIVKHYLRINRLNKSKNNSNTVLEKTE